jgi:hypothetical protein
MFSGCQARCETGSLAKKLKDFFFRLTLSTHSRKAKLCTLVQPVKMVNDGGCSDGSSSSRSKRRRRRGLLLGDLLLDVAVRVTKSASEPALEIL